MTGEKANNPVADMGDPHHFTPTERKFLDMLGDGRWHSFAELHTCLFDDLRKKYAVSNRMTSLRIKLRSQGLSILHERRGEDSGFRLVRLLSPADE